MRDDAGQFDYIVIGAGSAGAVVAARLSENANNRVLLLEAGGMDNHPGFRLPLLMGAFIKSGIYNWGYETEPEPHLDDRRIPWPRGRVIGGTSTLNGMVYIRGVPSDYDGWGLKGWSWDEVLPFFRKSEGHEDRGDPFHGTAGPLHVGRARGRNPLTQAFVEAGGQAGYPNNDDFNSARQEGFGFYDFTIRNGRRCGTARAFVRPSLSRKNLKLVTRALTTRIVIENGRATDVEYQSGNKLWRARAGRETILSAGAVNSPQILMLSGIGRAADLRGHGITPVLDLPGVGQNLQDHFDCCLVYESTAPVSLYRQLRVDRLAFALVRGLMFGKGAATVFPYEGGAFIRVQPGAEDPDIQIHFMHGREDTARLHGFGLGSGRPNDKHGFTLRVSPLRPESRGAIRLRSADPREAPVINANYLATEYDVQTTILGLRAMRQVVQQPAFDHCRGREIWPGQQVESDAEFRNWLGGAGGTTFHPVGTCTMGTAPDAVVDETLRVRGVEGLRVADASIMPRIVSGNTNAPSIMIGEKAAALISGEPTA
ncbi:GMC family oxidoreductase [Rhizobium leguminosarum]|uniref:GMC family oxidoreductase n=1 Tax=Rhizobium leguminosarum TaxID=384 RepID=UPI003F9B5EC3